MPNARNDDVLKNHKHFITDPVFLIGNGKSRQNFDLERLRPIGTIVGCNALYRDFIPDILVAIDSKMLKELKENHYGQKEGELLVCPSNRQYGVVGSLNWKTDRFNTSGCFAMKFIPAIIKPSKCYMIGMDGYPGNVYDKTRNYAPNTLQNFKGVHQYYMQALKASTGTIFVNVNEKDEWPQEAHDTGNYQFMTFEEFEKTVMAS